MIAVDFQTVGALEVAVRSYLTDNGWDSALAAATICANRIEIPDGTSRFSRGDVAALYDRIADVADGLANASLTVPGELHFRRAAAHLRQGARLLRGAGEHSVTRRIPTIPLAEAAGRLRAGKHRDSEPPATKPLGPLMERAGFASAPANWPDDDHDLGGES